MRDLKFRAWDNNSKEWLLGYERPNLGGFSMFGEVMLCGEWSSVLDRFILTQRDRTHNDLIVMQYTGLEDNQGKPIYEGDVLKMVVHRSYKFGETGQVKYEEDYGGFIVEGSYSKNQHHEHLDCDIAIESIVIGNIYSNPELIK